MKDIVLTDRGPNPLAHIRREFAPTASCLFPGKCPSIRQHRR